MKTPLQKVQEFIRSHAMLDGARGVLVAVSGGPDSLALLDMLVRLSIGDRRRGLGAGNEEEPKSRQKAEGGRRNAALMSGAQPVTPIPQPLIPITHLHVAHLDHMLRGRESAEDAEFVRRSAERLGLQFTIRSVDVRAAASHSGRGIEETAREIRYDFLLAVAREAECDRIAVGHTMTDQAETFLMRLTRGAGQRGLSAMRPVSTVPTGGEGEKGRGGDGEKGQAGVLIRPLLCITREEVHDYCRDRGLEFRTDTTNLTLDYTRNRVRSEVLPALRSINPRVVESISRAAENIAGDEDVLDRSAFSLLKAARLFSDSLLVDRSAAAYSVAALLAQPTGMRRRMIIEALRLASQEATRERADGRGEFGLAHVGAVEALLKPRASGKHVDLPCSLEAWREFDALVLKPNSPDSAASYQSAISSACPRVEAGGLEIELQTGLPVEMLKAVIEGALSERRRTGQDWMTVALDDHALPEFLVIRPRRRGERVHVVGRSRTIKLKNLMIDHRIPSSRRATWPIVTTPEGKYIWSPGLPPSIEFIARVETLRLATMRATVI